MDKLTEKKQEVKNSQPKSSFVNSLYSFCGYKRTEKESEAPNSGKKQEVNDWHVSEPDNYSISAWDSFKENKIINTVALKKAELKKIPKVPVDFMKLPAEPLPRPSDINRKFWAAGVLDDIYPIPVHGKSNIGVTLPEIFYVAFSEFINVNIEEIKACIDDIASNTNIFTYISSKVELKEDDWKIANMDRDLYLLCQILHVASKYNFSCFCMFADDKWKSNYRLVARTLCPMSEIVIIKKDNSFYLSK